MANNKGKKSTRKTNTRRAQRSQRAVLSQVVSPFPPLRKFKFRYTDILPMTEAAANAGKVLAFTPSSLYDPDNSGVGHQPMYYDQLCTSVGPYTRYRALASTVKLTFANTTSSSVAVGWYGSTTATTPASYYQALEKPMGQWRVLAGKDGTPSVVTFQFRFDHGKVMGVTRRHLLNDDYYAGFYNSSPSVNAFLMIWVWSQTGSIASVYCTMEMDIEAELFALGNNPSS